jgi:tRNA A-37 threonylcarbamoyl transferase component Bud32
MTDTPGTTRFGPYLLSGIIGQGATSTVYLATEATTHQQVAVKVLDPTLAAIPEVRQRLDAESEVLATIGGQHLVASRGTGEIDGRYYLAMDYVDGASLRAVERQAGRLSPPQALGVIAGVLEGLAIAHSHGLVHGDIKPENILVDRHGTSTLVDFGQFAAAEQTTTGGTPAYMSPEAAAGRPLEARSDLYSTGVVLYEALAARRPFEATSDLALLRMHAETDPPRITDLSDGINQLLASALAKDPAERPADAPAFLAALEAAAQADYGKDWRRGAAVALLVAGAATSIDTLAPAPASATPIPLTTAQAGTQLATSSTTTPTAPAKSVRTLAKPAKVVTTHPILAVAAAVVIIVAAVAGIAASNRSGAPKGHPAAVVAVAPTTLATTTTLPATSSPTTVDLRSINWGDVTVPGRACVPDITQNITLHNGQATVQDPNVHYTGSTGPGLPEQFSGRYPLQITIQPQFGQLTGGPEIAVLALTCSLSGVAAGLVETTAVFDAPDGSPHLLALFSDGQYGKIPGAPSALVPTRFQVSDGVINVYGSYLQGDDPIANPTGRGSTTIIYRNGTVVPSGVIAILPSASALSPASPTSPPTTSSTGGGRTITAKGYSGQTYTATIVATDQVADCAANSYGTALIQYFQQHPCPDGADLRLETIPYGGRTVALSIIAVSAMVGPPDNLYEYASQLAQLENAPNTGGLDDILRTGARPAGWPPAIPSNEAFVVMGEDDSVYIFDAWYLQGATTPQDPALVNLIRDIFLTPVS